MKVEVLVDKDGDCWLSTDGSRFACVQGFEDEIEDVRSDHGIDKHFVGELVGAPSGYQDREGRLWRARDGFWVCNDDNMFNLQSVHEKFGPLTWVGGDE